jgi:hypothetical protein
MYDNILSTTFNLRNGVINIDILLLHRYFEVLIFFMRYFVEFIGVDDEKDHDDDGWRYFNDYYDHGGDDNGDVVGKDVGAEGELIRNGLCIGSERTYHLGLAMGRVGVLVDYFL